ncbi:DUF1631 family protein [Curvibacter sp. PAE-UM]|uniref:DUF1631 family protein n=1 Tax=Curvibacter sp. PAE-UM TaxID=1714344 RepID=UPI000710354E|nr:DUF1631 family protein [Curvibacter sp. PAE-UM]KRH98479.1 hypothetical protein AO057_07515 [Curvibacter sp. PAE-UM]
MSTRPQPVARSAQLDGLIHEASRRGLDIMDGVLRQTRETLQQQIDQTRDLLARDARSRVVSVLVQSAPEMRARFPETLQRAFERELGDNPVTTTLDAGPSSIKFEQLELMDEQDVQVRISAARGLQQALQDAEQELTELNTLVSSILGFDQVRPERNPFRPEIYVEALQGLISEMQGDSAAQTQCRQIMVPLLGKSLRPVYQELLAYLKMQKVQPVRYAIQRGAFSGAPVVGHEPGQVSPIQTAMANGPAPVPPPQGGLAQQVYAGQLTVQQLHGLVSGATPDADQLVQEVVKLILASITGDERILPPVRELIAGLKPALLQLARSDLHFFSDKQHPARQLLEELAQHSFAYDRAEAEGFAEFLSEMRQALAHLTPAAGGAPETFERVLVRLRQRWSQADKRRLAQQQAAVQALQQAEKRNQLARQIAEHIRKQPGTVLVPDLMVDFACGPWAQVMAQAQIDGKVEQPGAPDYVALLEDLFWSVRPDQARQQPGQLVKIIPQLVKGLRQGLESIHYPPEQLQNFLDQLFALHQGGLDSGSAARSLKPAAPPVARTWLAPEEARDSGFMDDLGAEETPDFASTVPAEFPAEFPATEPMGLVEGENDDGQVLPDEGPATAVPALSLDQLQPGSWVELLVSGHWMRLQLAWLSDNASLCLFSSAGGSNHSMTRRMFDRLVVREHLRLVTQGPVVERAFDAVAELAMRNSVYMDIQADPPA